MTRRYRRRNAKPGQLLVYYGKLPHNNPDIVFAWGGEGADKHDAMLLHYALSCKRQRMVYGPERERNGGHPLVFDPSVIEELESRGYDITTLTLSIQKKVTSAVS